jgi:DNA-binding NarL/FixJ family response regulator
MTEHKNLTTETPAMILIVEDHAELRVRLRSWLEFMFTQYQVVDLQNAEDALDILTNHSPALVLMDIGLPGMNGIEATRAIKQKEPKISVIVTTQQPGTGHKDAALKAGADVFIPKDQLFRDLIPVMEQLLFA